MSKSRTPQLTRPRNAHLELTLQFPHPRPQLPLTRVSVEVEQQLSRLPCQCCIRILLRHRAPHIVPSRKSQSRLHPAAGLNATARTSVPSRETPTPPTAPGKPFATRAEQWGPRRPVDDEAVCLKKRDCASPPRPRPPIESTWTLRELRNCDHHPPRAGPPHAIEPATETPVTMTALVHAPPSPSPDTHPSKRARQSSPGPDRDSPTSLSAGAASPASEHLPDAAGGAGGTGGGKAAGGGGQSSSFRNVSACNRCRLRKNRCDQKLPSCASCEKAGVACVGYDPITKREIPRRYVWLRRGARWSCWRGCARWARPD